MSKTIDHGERILAWSEYKRILVDYAAMSSEARKRWVFRGQANAHWRLETTLDRIYDFQNITERNEHLNTLIKDFEREASGLDDIAIAPTTNWEVVGRHHGLPCTLLDWTESPYIAAFFAFDECAVESWENVCIWCFDRSRLQDEHLKVIQFIENDEAAYYVKRMRAQRGLMMRVLATDPPLETALDGTLQRFVLSAKERNLALADLDEMVINARSMYLDYDAVARVMRERYPATKGLRR